MDRDMPPAGLGRGEVGAVRCAAAEQTFISHLRPKTGNAADPRRRDNCRKYHYF